MVVVSNRMSSRRIVADAVFYASQSSWSPSTIGLLRNVGQWRWRPPTSRTPPSSQSSRWFQSTAAKWTRSSGYSSFIESTTKLGRAARQSSTFEFDTEYEFSVAKHVSNCLSRATTRCSSEQRLACDAQCRWLVIPTASEQPGRSTAEFSIEYVQQNARNTWHCHSTATPTTTTTTATESSSSEQFLCCSKCWIWIPSTTTTSLSSTTVESFSCQQFLCCTKCRERSSSDESIDWQCLESCRRSDPKCTTATSGPLSIEFGLESDATVLSTATCTTFLPTLPPWATSSTGAHWRTSVVCFIAFSRPSTAFALCRSDVAF